MAFICESPRPIRKCQKSPSFASPKTQDSCCDFQAPMKVSMCPTTVESRHDANVSTWSRSMPVAWIAMQEQPAVRSTSLFARLAGPCEMRSEKANHEKAFLTVSQWSHERPATGVSLPPGFLERGTSLDPVVGWALRRKRKRKIGTQQADFSSLWWRRSSRK